MSGSLPDEVLAFLRRHGLAAEGESPAAEALAGGVSSDIWRVRRRGATLVVKRALPRLRVAQLWEAPVERNRYERRWLERAAAIVPGATPRVLAADDAGCFAMEDLGACPVWKAELLAGRADAAFAAEVGARLGRVHAATAGRDDVAREFATDASFHALRLEPYLLASARAHPAAAGALQGLSEATAGTRLALVHGDVSPKNILVAPGGPVFLDAECAWYGDPAFDLAFCLNHLLLKCAWRPAATAGYLGCFGALWSSYRQAVRWESPQALEGRTCRLLPGLMLARVDGKSPVEYLTDEATRARVRGFALRHLAGPPPTLDALQDAWRRSSTS